MLAKKYKSGNEETVEEHMKRSAEVAKVQYDRLSQGVKDILPSRALCVFLATVHDIGKTSPVFQAWINERKGLNKPRHWIISYQILIRSGFNKSLCVVAGSHHGTPPDKRILHDMKEDSYDHECGFDSLYYRGEQEKMLEHALSLSGLQLAEQKTVLGKLEQMILTGFVILCDWMASNEEMLEFAPAPVLSTPSGPLFFKERFGNDPRPIQSTVIDIFEQADKSSNIGMVIVEAPMGEGKTEAALAAAEIMMARSKRRGVFFALPTQSTSNAMFTRVKKWINSMGLNEVATIDLLHGKKMANTEFRELALQIDSEDRVAVNRWFNGRKKSLFADFVIGTVDHLLMGALKQKHVMLRHLALSGKVVIIDECHAYDSYMDMYLCRILEWLGSYSVPVVLLSATLPHDKRKELLYAYMGEDRSKKTGNKVLNTSDYPLISYTDGDGIHEKAVSAISSSKEIHLKTISDTEIKKILQDKLSDGGCAGVIVNTVKRAQQLHDSLKSLNAEIILFHSRFTAEDRAMIETGLIERLGKDDGKRKGPLIVIGTQVLESSLDIDFDLLITDLAPMDILIQRLGRLFRHMRTRPDKIQKPVCYITDSDASLVIYSEYLIARTRALLPEAINLPHDIPVLVNLTYDGSEGPGKTDYEFMIQDKRGRAENFRLAGPEEGLDPSIIGLLHHPVEDSDQEAEASVRDGQDTVEVVVVFADEDITRFKNNDFEAMKRSLRLPYVFGADAVEELKESGSDDFGNRYLLFNKNHTAYLCGYQLMYTKEKGLTYERI